MKQSQKEPPKVIFIDTSPKADESKLKQGMQEF